METTGTRALARRSRAHWWIVAASFGALLGLLAMRVLLTPSPNGFGTHEQLGLPPCRSMDWFGIPCPGCGVTTSVAWFADGELVSSLVVQPLGFVLGCAALLGLPLAVLATLFGRDLGEDLTRLRTRAWWMPAIAFTALAWLYKIAVTLVA